MLARDILGTAGRSNNIIAFATLSVLMYSYIFFSHFLYIAFYELSTVIMTKTNRAKLRQVAVLGRGRGASAPLLFVQPPTSFSTDYLLSPHSALPLPQSVSARTTTDFVISSREDRLCTHL